MNVTAPVEAATPGGTRRRGRSLMTLLALVLLSTSASPMARGQDATTTNPHADEPIVIEKTSMHETVAADGSKTVDVESRVRVQSSAGVQQMGTLRVSYARDGGSVEYRYARVRKPGGAVVETPVSGAIDVPADLTQAAPMYSDEYIKHLNVQALSVGDTLEYATRLRARPAVSGTFSTEQDLAGGAILLDGEYRLTVPTRLGVSVKSGVEQPVVTTSGGLTTYAWRYNNLERVDATKAAVLAHTRQSRRADVQATSFKSWADVGAAVQRLWRDRLDSAPVLRDKARELTAGSQTDAERLRAIFAFVALKIRYVGIEMGLGRIQPRRASEVLANGFGDCKDKHILLAALLREVGIRAEPALIGPGQPFDDAVPSLGQFNHVVTFVPDVSGGLWMDATLEVAPPGLLAGQELDQHSLLVPASGPAAITRTPTRSLRATELATDVTGELDANGTLTAQVSESYSGDYELLLRRLLRLLPSTEWKEAAKQLPLVQRTAGEVSDLRISNPEDPDGPIRVNYTLTKAKYVDLADMAMDAVLPIMGLLRLDKDALPPVPLSLGAAGRARSTSRITLPAGHTARLRSGSLPELRIDNELLSYQIRNTLQGDVFETQRTLDLKTKEVAVGAFPTYLDFFDTVGEYPSSIVLRPIKPWTWGDGATVEWYAGVNAAAVSTLQAAVAAANRAEYATAISMVGALVRRDPSTAAPAGVVMAWAQIRSGDRELGLRTLSDLVRTAPSASGYKMLAMHLRNAGRDAESAAAWAEGRAAFPDDPEFPLYLGEQLLRQSRFEEAAEVLASATAREPRSSRLFWNLGKARAAAGRPVEAVQAFRQGAEADTSAYGLNQIAWSMAESAVGLDDALRFAQRAVNDTEARAAALLLPGLDVTGLRLMSSLAAYWDTLSLVLFKSGRLADAEVYQAAAWDLAQEGEYALRLADILEAKGDRKGVVTYITRAALAHTPAPSALRRLSRLEPSEQARTNLLLENSNALAHEWTTQVPAIPGVTGSADLFVRVGPNGSVEDVRFVSGDATMRPAAEMVRAAKMPSRLPPGSVARLVRRGTLTCAGTTSTCALALTRVGAVTSVN